MAGWPSSRSSSRRALPSAVTRGAAGTIGVLPDRLRIASLSSLLIYVLIALVLLRRASLTTLGPSDGVVRVAAWAVTGYFVVGTVMNALSRSRAERQLMTPTAAALAALSLVVALGE